MTDKTLMIMKCWWCKNDMQEITPKRWRTARRYICKQKDHTTITTEKVDLK